MTNRFPLVSIGLALFNDGKYLSQSLDSLLSQDFEDFEVIISDNASEDATQQICLDYTARDPRLRYYRNSSNVGGVKNFNRVFELSQGKYFIWASGHDLWHPRYLSRCLEILENDPRVVLCYPQVAKIDQVNKSLGVVQEGLETRFLNDFERFRAVIRGLAKLPICDPIYGLIKSDALRKTRLMRNIWGPDHLILLEISFSGAIAHIKKPLYYRRRLPEREANLEDWTDQYLIRLEPRNRWKRLRLTFSQMCFEYLITIYRSPFLVWQKMKLVIDTFHTFWSVYRYGIIYRDIICGLLHLLFGESATYYILKRYPYRLGKFLRNHLRI